MRMAKPLETMVTALDKMSGAARGGDGKAFAGKGLKGFEARGGKPAEAKTPGRESGEKKPEGSDRRAQPKPERKDGLRDAKKSGGDKKSEAFERLRQAKFKTEAGELDKLVREDKQKEATKRSFKKAEFFHDIEEKRKKREAQG